MGNLVKIKRAPSEINILKSSIICHRGKIGPAYKIHVFKGSEFLEGI